MTEIRVARAELEPLCPFPVLFDALVGQGESWVLFEKVLTMEDPGVAAQRVTPRWPHHLPGELVIALTGQAGFVALHRLGLIGAGWRGHGVRIRDARYSDMVLVGERFFTRVEVGRTRRLRDSLFAPCRFRMWKIGPGGSEIETYSSEQDAIFFPG